MARARNIKPGFFKNEILGVADPLYSLLFEGLWVLADRCGRLEDRPLRIKAEIFPYRDGLDMNAMLEWLVFNGFIQRYTSEGKKCILVVEFVKHQNPHKNESESELPAPVEKCTKPDQIETDTEIIGTSSEIIGSTRADSLYSDSLYSDSLIAEGSGTPQSVEPPAITIPLVDKSEYPVPDRMVSEWALAYPAVDVMQQLREMRAWCIANPANRKTARGIQSFIVRWLGKEQDKGGGRRAQIETWKERDARLAREKWERMTGEQHPENAPTAPPRSILDVFDVDTKTLEFIR